VSLAEADLRAAGLLVLAAYAVMGAGFFRPAWNRHKAEAAPARGAREIPRAVDLLWVSTQGWVLLALVGAAAAPALLASVPTSLAASSNFAAALTGASVAVAGCALVAWASRELGAELTVNIEVREGGRLVVTGPFARVRHPIYTGVFLIVFGAAFAIASPLLAACGAVAVYCARVRALAEEELLSQDAVHGPQYRAYLAQTGRFFPRLRTGAS
jgi:protein-S-isoprenylcysteine O-methyltransferase Ste14